MQDFERKIQSLLRLALSDNPHEAALALERAKALSEKHSFDIRQYFHFSDDISDQDFNPTACDLEELRELVHNLEIEVLQSIVNTVELRSKIRKLEENEVSWKLREAELLSILDAAGIQHSFEVPNIDLNDSILESDSLSFEKGVTPNRGRLRLRNAWEILDNTSFIWKIFLTDDGSGALKDVLYVTYYLHETFEESVQCVFESQDGFSFTAEGWGVFNVRATVVFYDGDRLDLEHFLEAKHIPSKGVSS